MVRVSRTRILCGADRILYFSAHPPRCTSRQSKIALAWLLEQQQKLREIFNDSRIQIRHAFNSYTEFIAEDSHRVDGYVEYEGILLIYQFYGCYWHGYTTCHDPAAEHSHFKQPYSRAYEQTLKQEELLYRTYERSGKKYQIHTVWEHEYTMAVDRGGYDLEVLSNIMGDRDMFFGGHVNVFQPLVRVDTEAGEHIRYINITSHYANICAHLPLRTGHPTRLLGPEIDRRRLDPKHPKPY
jgi:hypothetical protein